jgi:DeoR family fructose operon transcriptional repressor
MLGGMIRRGFHYVNTSGLPLPNINVDKMFFSCNALSVAMGATVPDFQLAAGVRSIAKLASELILLCDSSKIGASTFAQIAPLNEIDTIVVDSDVSKDDLEELQQNGSNVVVALNPSTEE